MKSAFTFPLTLDEMEAIAGGHPFEEKFADYALYRAGITCDEHMFGSDEFRIGSTKISKDLAKSLRSRSSKVWANYSASGDYVAYARAWKVILANEYGIAWNGEMGRLIGYCD
ncbi:MAG: hypothetical protein IIY60_01450 [Clostridia bacterium]|nr:hypothetical protein [Clostridia bacterium]